MRRCFHLKGMDDMQLHAAMKGQSLCTAAMAGSTGSEGGSGPAGDADAGLQAVQTCEVGAAVLSAVRP